MQTRLQIRKRKGKKRKHCIVKTCNFVDLLKLVIEKFIKSVLDMQVERNACDILLDVTWELICFLLYCLICNIHIVLALSTVWLIANFHNRSIKEATHVENKHVIVQKHVILTAYRTTWATNWHYSFKVICVCRLKDLCVIHW